MKIVYIQWEGRGYTPESWQADMAATMTKLGGGPIEVAPYDVGLLVRRVDDVVGPIEIYGTRHGELDAPWDEEEHYYFAPTIAGEWEGPYANLQEVEEAHREDWFA